MNTFTEIIDIESNENIAIRNDGYPRNELPIDCFGASLIPKEMAP